MTRLLHHRALPWITGIGLFVLVVAWTFTTTPRYRSEALLQVEGKRGAGAVGDLMSKVPGGDLLGLGQDELETQVGVLRSRRVLDAVMDSLGLDVSLIEPRSDGSPMFTATTSRSDSSRVAEVEGALTLTAGENGAWTVDASLLKGAASVATSLRSGETLQVGPHRITLAADLAARDIAELQFAIAPRYLTARGVSSRLDVHRQNAGAQLIALTFDDADPRRAADVLARVLNEYLAFVARAARGDAGSTVSELRRQIAEQQSRLTRAENELRAYQERTGLVLPEEQGAAQVKRYATLRGTLDQLEVERDALAQLVQLVESRAARDPNSAAYRQLATFPSLITNRSIQDLLQALLTLENDRSRLLMVRNAENPDVRRLTARISEIENDLLRLGKQYLESLGSQIAPTRAAMNAIDGELARLPERELQLMRLFRERTLLNEGYVALQQQLRLTEVQDALRLDEVRVVDAPQAAHPDDPYFPRVPVHILLAIVLALASGGAVAAFQGAIRPATAASSRAE